jgi:hypothetical protein
VPAIRLNPAAAITPTALGVCVRTDLETLMLGGADASAFVAEVAPLLDGTRDRAAISLALGGYSPRSVTALLDALEARGLVEAVPETPPPSGLEGGSPHRGRRGQEGFARAWSLGPEVLTARLAEARVLVVGRAPWCATAAIELQAAGVGAVRRAGDDDALEREAQASWSLLVAAVAPENLERIARIARFAHRARLISLWSHLAGTKALLGPLVMPGETACRLCATVEALNPPAARAEAVDAGADPRHQGRERLLGHHLAMEALKVLSGYTISLLGGRLLIQDLATRESSRHTLVRVPWCRVCG